MGGESQKDAQVLLAVPRHLVKSTKDALQRHQRLDRSAKIRPFCATEAVVYLPFNQDIKSSQENYLIPTTVMACPDDDELEKSMLNVNLLDMINVDQHTHPISIYLRNSSSPGSPLPIHEPSQPTSILGQIIQTWLLALPPHLLPFPISDLISVSSWSYIIYHPLLLLPQNTFSTPPWPDILSTTLRTHLPALYTLLSSHLKITHIALNTPIPTLIPGTTNILRKPADLIPLYGSFGPSLSPTHIPSSTDFEAAFWCTVRQNGIFQTWAPRHTMFSRGNISEKTRLLILKTLTTEGLGGNLTSATSAVDLYAGIGYFAFCYAKLGVGKVFCWELSGWSVEGLRRGSTGNGWGVEVFDAEAIDTEDIRAKLLAHEQKQILVFQEDNQNAADRITALRSHIPPIRHVNCGFLPTSQGSWETAVRALDPQLGGWIHAHENIERGSFEKRKEEIVWEFRELVRKWKKGGEKRSEQSEQPEQSEQSIIIMNDDDITTQSPKTKTVIETENTTNKAEAEAKAKANLDLDLDLDLDLESTKSREEDKEEEDGTEMTTMATTMIVECVHFEQVKSYAPGIVHCVLDIAVIPR